MAKIIHSPKPYDKNKKTVFLAGSIEQGSASLWQEDVQNALKHLDIQILNPRRKKWKKDATSNPTDPYFKEQVIWELDGLKNADIIFLFLDPHTRSPISLLELGLYAESKKLIIVCPKDFWRYGNVEIVSGYYNINLFYSLKEGISALAKEIKN